LKLAKGYSRIKVIHCRLVGVEILSITEQSDV
jgi:hypothetical protein